MPDFSKAVEESGATIDGETKRFYLRAMEVMEGAGIAYVVGGAYSLAHYAGIVRHTKDLDLFIQEKDLERAFAVAQKEGWRTEKTHPHWVAKAFCGDAFVDLIYSSGNGLCPVDEEWLAHATPGKVLGRSAPLCPAEEIIWTKAYIMERDRFDGADIAHLILHRGEEMDWERLLRRFGEHGDLLLGHLIHFRFIYPTYRARVPEWVMERLWKRSEKSNGKMCRGTLVSWQQYLPDVRSGMCDARLHPHGRMTEEEVERWTKAEK